MRSVRALALAVLLAGCSATNDDPQAVTADEAQQLNDAAAMLDANSVSPEAVPEATEANSDNPS